MQFARVMGIGRNEADDSFMILIFLKLHSMKYRIKNLILFLALGVFLFICLERAEASDDGQYWNEFILKHSVTPQLETHLKLEQRFVDDFGDFGLHNYAPGILYKVTQYFDFELNYKFEREKGEKEWTNEHRLEIIPILKGRWGGFGFKLKNRLEYRDIEGDESWRLREKIIIARTVNVNGSTFKPYFSEEIFYDFRVGDFNQNRIAAGILKKINRNLEVGLYYLYKTSKKKSDWSGANILGTEFVISF